MNDEATGRNKKKINDFFSYLIVVMPKDVLGRFGTVLDDASQVDVTADVDVELGSAQNHRLGSCRVYITSVEAFGDRVTTIFVSIFQRRKKRKTKRRENTKMAT